jgi:hypothetical protein
VASRADPPQQRLSRSLLGFLPLVIAGPWYSSLGGIMGGGGCCRDDADWGLNVFGQLGAPATSVLSGTAGHSAA